MKWKARKIIDSRNISKIQKENRRGNTQIHDRSLSGLGTGTSIKSGGVKLAWQIYKIKK